MPMQLGLWLVFAILIVGMTVLDLGVLNRRPHAASPREAALWCVLWVALALIFNVIVYFWKGHEQALLFLTSYLVEESLSLDNLFVFLLIFEFFLVPERNWPRLLFWGVLGAIFFRGLFIAAGVTLIHRFNWMVYIFGAFLIFTGIKLITQKDQKIQPDHNPVIRLVKRVMPVTDAYAGDHYFIRQNARRAATPLFVALLMLPTTDVIFAVDSIPAVLAISTDPFIVYTSNIFAVLGLRAFFFVLAGFMKKFRFLHYGLAMILAFIGAKMLLSGVFHLGAGLALGVVAGILALTVLASVIWKSNDLNSGEDRGLTSH